MNRNEYFLIRTAIITGAEQAAYNLFKTPTKFKEAEAADLIMGVIMNRLEALLQSVDISIDESEEDNGD